jgi:hypothetical protein
MHELRETYNEFTEKIIQMKNQKQDEIIRQMKILYHTIYVVYVEESYSYYYSADIKIFGCYSTEQAAKDIIGSGTWYTGGTMKDRQIYNFTIVPMTDYQNINLQTLLDIDKKTNFLN